MRIVTVLLALGLVSAPAASTPLAHAASLETAGERDGQRRQV